MFIPELQEFSSAHPPTPYGWPLPIQRDGKWGSGILPTGAVLRAVGWLGNQVPSSGDTREECIDRLFAAYERGLVLFDATRGWHDCEICTIEDQHCYPGGAIHPVVHWRGRDLSLEGHGHYLIRNQDVVYMAPALILHYILDHHYRPPDEFVEGVIVGSFLRDQDLVFALGESP